MDYRKFLGKEERLIFPYLGGNVVEGYERVLRVKERPTRGWHLFRVVGRNAWPIEAAAPPESTKVSTIRGHYFGGYLFGEGGRVAELELCEGEPADFAPCKALLWNSGDWIFSSFEFECEAEGNTRLALEELRPLVSLREIPATLRMAYGFAILTRVASQSQIQVAPVEVLADLAPIAEMGVSQANLVLLRLTQARSRQQVTLSTSQSFTNDAYSTIVHKSTVVCNPLNDTPGTAVHWEQLDEIRQARARSRLEQKNKREHQQYVRQLARGGRPLAMASTSKNAAERAEAALEAAGARLLSSRIIDRNRMEVQYRFLGNRFITVVDPISLQVLDAGICLSGEDRKVTLDSLPSVIREGMGRGLLVITRHR